MKNYIEKYWLLFIIITQPILDIIAYFTFDNKLTIISFTIRSLYLLFIIVYTFFKSKDKKKYILTMLPFVIFIIFHVANSYRISNLNIFDDIRYIVSVMQFPILTIALIDYLKFHKKDYIYIENGIYISYIIIFISVILSVITNSYSTTYGGYGLTGWFTSANTQSMILMVTSPLFLYFCSKKKDLTYYLGLIMVFILLYFNGTRACYYTLIFSNVVLIYVLCLKKSKNYKKLIVTILLFVVCIGLYNFSFTSDRKLDVDNSINNREKEIVDLINKDNLTKEETITVLKSSYLFDEAIKDLGTDDVYEVMKDKINLYNLGDNRLLKRVYGKVVFKNSDTLTKLVGINHNVIANYGKDLENDFTAIFYYYGYIGFSLYCLFILYFAFLGIKILILKPIKLISPKFVIFTFTILLSLFGAEYSGALLRKTNANIYVSLLFALYYLYLICSDNNDNYKVNINNNKITFLLLHLGYGGIESATINTANSLCDNYEVELVSFYNLKKNQNNKIDERIGIKYLYNGEPNKDEFVEALHGYRIFKVIKEGFRSINILIKKRVFVIRFIIHSDSKYIVSTRWEFSELLSKYGNNNVIKIAQEHHYHNNNNKYINVLKNKYYNINYLFALTKTLEEDYKKFLVKNKHTKVVLVPNMLYYMPSKQSKLDKKNIITVSRLDYGKRNDEIIKAFSKIKEKDWKLYIVGDGKEFNNLNKLINDLNMNERITLTGYKNKEEIEEYMLKSSLFLMASETEGLPMVLLEAMSYGIPCIAYEVASGVNDIIDNNKNGYIIKNRNEEEYIEKIEKVINDSKLRNELGIEAKNKVNEFSKEKIVKIWKKILK